MKRTLNLMSASILLGGALLGGFIGFAYASSSKHGHNMSTHQVTTGSNFTGGQAAFAEIATIVQELQDDTNTDWSTVNIEALRKHLIDMNNVTLVAGVTAKNTENGAIFTVSGTTEQVVSSIQNMTSAHGVMMGDEGLEWVMTPISNGARIEVQSSNTGGVTKIRALGFHGLMTLGNHHAVHHRMMAKGTSQH